MSFKSNDCIEYEFCGAKDTLHSSKRVLAISKPIGLDLHGVYPICV